MEWTFNLWSNNISLWDVERRRKSTVKYLKNEAKWMEQSYNANCNSVGTFHYAEEVRDTRTDEILGSIASVTCDVLHSCNTNKNYTKKFQFSSAHVFLKELRLTWNRREVFCPMKKITSELWTCDWFMVQSFAFGINMKSCCWCCHDWSTGRFDQLTNQ